MLTLSDVTLRMQGRLLLEDASVFLPEGAKAGLVGHNGTGKTTLLRAITGDFGTEAGTIELRRGRRIGQVAQEAPGTEVSLLDTVLEADTERAALLAEAETATDPTRIADIHTRLADIDAHSAEARAATILHGLGFDAAAQARPCSSFSGGWRMRVALAAVLFSQPDLLLLDEPTNYLDLEGTLWLESYLARFPHTVLIVSHDRDLLNAACTSILHLENRKLTLYSGNYDTFARERAEKLSLMAKAKAKQDAKRAHMQAFVDRFRAKATKARQAQSRLKALARMGESASVHTESAPPLHFPSPEKVPASPIIAAQAVSVGYGETKVLDRLTLRIDADDRIALLGANGNGKSTFAKFLADRLTPMEGGVTRADKLRVAMFAQHNMDDLTPEWTAVDHVRARMPKEGEAKVRAAVARFGLATEKMETKAKHLSGGEKARLLLGLATFDKPHLLILDEPTNHLDMESREHLAVALNDYSGAVIVISHDRHLLEASAERLWLVEDGDVKPFEGDLEDYRRYVLRGEKPKPAAEKAAPKALGADRRKQAAAKRSSEADTRKRVTQLESIMAKAEAAIREIDQRLAAASTQGDGNRIAKLATKKAEFERRLVEVEEEWLDLSSSLEDAA